MKFGYYMPVKLVCGRDCVRENAALFAPFGKKALIVTGKSSKTNGALADAEEALSSNGQSSCVYDKVPPNPTVASVREGGRLAREFGAEFIIAIGGGSPMDAAKAIAMLARQEAEDIFSYAPSDDVLPMIHIPTTAGTGSEVTPYSILTNDEKQTKTSISNPAFFSKTCLSGRQIYAFAPAGYDRLHGDGRDVARDGRHAFGKGGGAFRRARKGEPAHHAR